MLPALRWRLEARARCPHVVRGGVLADEVGYGKTVITIALIDAAPRVPRTPPAPLRADGFIPLKATLVLAPSHLLKQWPREVQKFSGGALKCVVISTMADVNKLTIRELQTVDVVVCSITLLRSDLYFNRLANLAGELTLPASKANQRHFGSAYGAAMTRLQEQVSAADPRHVRRHARRRATPSSPGKRGAPPPSAPPRRLGGHVARQHEEAPRGRASIFRSRSAARCRRGAQGQEGDVCR